ADPAHRAVISGLKLDDVQGLSFSGIEFADGVAVQGSRQVAITDNEIHADGPNGRTGGGYVLKSSDVDIARNEIHDPGDGIKNFFNDHVTIAHNKFHNLERDGVDNCVVSYVTIEDNAFRDFHPIAANQDHPDAIQFWTNPAPSGNEHVTIARN